MKGLISKALLFATTGHINQIDKGGEDYILHPIRIMQNMDTIEEKLVAILHDTMEDCKATEEDLKNIGMPKDVIEAVKVLTKEKREDYFKYIKRVKQNSIARRVKMADLEDNMNLKRIKSPTEKDFERFKKYQRAFDYLIELEKI
ncbi:TPA: GTP pyrophosphokinase [Clostridium botulinum]|nr:GTP pyrophosphokinase [Clostridium botulinum]